MIDVTRLPHANAETIYAIGDIHGRLDLLETLEAAIAADIAASGGKDPLICYLGDYIDRGPNSAQVIDKLCAYADRGPSRVFLKGNHEDRMIAFLVEPDKNGPAWMKFGGREALESYGISVPGEPGDADWMALCEQLNAVLPERHRNFLSGLQLGIRWHEYLLVHAGLDPDRPLTGQTSRDLMWIREPFLNSDKDWRLYTLQTRAVCARKSVRRFKHVRPFPS